jgi:hypothetical protein
LKKIDYKTLEGSQAQTEEQFDKRWWKVNKTDRAKAISFVVKQLGDYDTRRQSQYQTSVRLYGNIDLLGLNGMSMSKSGSVQGAVKDRISYNIVQSVIDTVVAKMAKNKPKPLFLTSGGNFKQQRKAKKLDKFVDGIFYENKISELRNVIRRDAGVLGDGIVQVFEYNKRVKFQRVLASELYVDWMEAFYGEPRQIHRVKNVDRQVLIEQFPGKERAIKDANAASDLTHGELRNVADQVTVVESWHLPSGPEAKDGLHCICLEDETLEEEEWTKDFFPFARESFGPRMYGYWSQGSAERLQNIQLELNKILWVESRSFHLAGTFKVFLQKGSKVVKEHLSNEIGAVVEYTGAEPKYVVPPVLPPGFEERKQFLINAAYQQEGVSQLSASSQKPAGLNSGKALREYNDIESDRFMTIGQADECFHLDLARLAISVAKDIAEREGGYEVKYASKRFTETIDWKDIDLDEDAYVMKMYPVSSLPNDPAGRLQTVQEYMQAGVIDPITGRRLLDFPDLEQVESLGNAQEEWINMVLEKIVDDGEYSPPEPEMDLQLSKRLVLQYIAEGHTNDLDPERMELLRNFNTQLDALAQAGAPPPMAGGMGPGGQPQASPMAPPQSDLIPNVPMPQGAA